MMFFTIILVLLILLILISITNTFISIALKLVTRQHYNENTLILPSLMTIFLWITSYMVIIKTISKITGLSIYDSVFAMIFNTLDLNKFITSISLPIIGIIIITLFLQAFVLLTVNFEYTKMYNRVRYFIKEKVYKIKLKFVHDDTEIISNYHKKEVTQVEEIYKLHFINSFVCGLFIFSLLFFLNIIFFWIGTLIANKMI